MAAIGILGAAGQVESQAAEPKVIGSFKNWSAHLFSEKKSKVCSNRISFYTYNRFLS